MHEITPPHIGRSQAIALRFCFLCLVSAAGKIIAQPAIAVAGGGYRNPAVFRVAPGQVISVFVNGVKTLLPLQTGTGQRIQRATSVPLPTSLAGYSVRIQQGTRTFDLPVFSVQQVPLCSNIDQGSALPSDNPACWMTDITVQIPFELAVQPLPDPVPVITRLIVKVDDAETNPITVFPFNDNIHVVTGCDSGPNALAGVSDDLCSRTVTHGDGTLVSTTSPARPGEVVIVYAVGVGKVDRAPLTGAPPTGDAGQVSGLALRFDFSTNAGPSRPTSSAEGIVYAGLTPGFVGLYQINVRLPERFPAVPACTPQSTAITSNLTITISRAASFDGAGICVQPPGT